MSQQQQQQQQAIVGTLNTVCYERRVCIQYIYK